MDSTRELGILLFPKTNRDYTYIRVLARRHSTLLTPPIRCTFTSLPPNNVGLFLIARLAEALGEKNVIIKCVERTFYPESIPSDLREKAKECRLVRRLVAELRKTRKRL